MKTTSVFTGRGPDREHLLNPKHSLVCWRTIFGGLLIALITYITLAALGVGIGGSSAANMIQEGGNAERLATGAVAWIALAVLLSLAAGSYFAARTSTLITGRMGAAQGILITALFFGVMMYGAGQSIGFAGKALSSIVGAAGATTKDLASSPMVQNTIENSLGDVTLKSSPATVVQGLASRLVQGDKAGAKRFLAAQTGLTETELNARYAEIEKDFTNTVQTASAETAKAISTGAWSMFWILTLGLATSALCGALGSRVNFKHPLADEDTHPVLARTVAV